MIEIIIAIIVIAVIWELIKTFGAGLLKLVLVIIGISLVIYVASLILSNFNSIILFLCIVGIVGYILDFICRIVTYKRRKLEKQLTDEIMSLDPMSPVNNYENLINYYMQKYTAEFVKVSRSEPEELQELIKKNLNKLCDSNKKTVASEIDGSLKMADITSDYKTLLYSYTARYKDIMLGENDLDEIIKEKLELICNKNKEVLAENIKIRLQSLGMQELDVFIDECNEKYGNYCVGIENIKQLIMSYTKSIGEEVLNDGELILIKYPGATSGETFQQNIIELS